MSEKAFKLALNKIANDTWSYSNLPKEISSFVGNSEELFDLVLKVKMQSYADECLREAMNKAFFGKGRIKGFGKCHLARIGRK